MVGSQIDLHALVYPLANYPLLICPITLLYLLPRSEGIAFIFKSSIHCKILLRDTGLKSSVSFYPLQSYQLYGSHQIELLYKQREKGVARYNYLL